MTAFWILMAAAAVAAGLDWLAVGTGRLHLEYAAKPAVVAALIGASVALPATHTDLIDRRWWFVAALVCCLAGDVALMVPRNLFVPGLVAFLAGHLLYIVGLLQPPASTGTPPFAFSTQGLVVAAVVIGAVEAFPLSRLLIALARHHRPLMGPVVIYVVAIVTMVVLALNVGVAAAGIGAVLFLVSDTVLALDRFTRPLPRGQLLVHVTYHLAQGLLVLSLVR